MSTLHRRIDAIEAAHSQRQQRKGETGIVESVRAMLESVDGQADLDMRPGENIHTVMVRRLQGTDGWTLDGIPGDTLADKMTAVDHACRGKVNVSPEARHAARHWFAMYEVI